MVTKTDILHANTPYLFNFNTPSSIVHLWLYGDLPFISAGSQPAVEAHPSPDRRGVFQDRRGSSIERTFLWESGERDVQLVEDPNGSPLWARYYDQKHCKPFVCDRDSVPRQRLEDIGSERRNCYAWYGDRTATLYSIYEQWAEKHVYSLGKGCKLSNPLFLHLSTASDPNLIVPTSIRDRRGKSSGGSCLRRCRCSRQ